MHRPVRPERARQLLPRLPPGGPDGPPGAAPACSSAATSRSIDWVPTRVKIHAIADESQTRALCDLFPGALLDCTAAYGPGDRACEGRHKRLDVYQMLELSWGEGTVKSHRYGELLRAVMADQVAWIRDRSHPRRITERQRPGFPGRRLRGRSTGSHVKESRSEMPLKRLYERLLLNPSDVKPTRDDFEVVGVFNPGAVRIDGEVILLVRVAQRPRETAPGPHRAAPMDQPRRADRRLGSERRTGARRSPGRATEGRRPGAAHVHVAPASRPLRRRPIRHRGYRHAVPAGRRAGGIRCRGPADHAALRTVLFHVCRGFAARGGDGPGLDGRLPRVLARRGDLLLREQGRRPFPRLDRRSPRGASPSQPGHTVLPPRDVGRLVAGHHSLGPSHAVCTAAGRTGRMAGSVRALRRFAFPTAGWKSTTAAGTPTSPGPSASIPRAPCCWTPRTPRTSFAAPRNPSSSLRLSIERQGFVPDVVFPTGIVETEKTFLVYYGAADTCTAVVEFSRDELMAALV